MPGYLVLRSHAIVTKLKRITGFFFYTFQEYISSPEIERPPHDLTPERFFLVGFLINLR